MTENEMRNHLTKHLSISAQDFSSEDYKIMGKLIKDGTAVCCSDITHCHLMLNPDYVYVLNNEEGRFFALNPLYTSNCGRFATKNAKNWA